MWRFHGSDISSFLVCDTIGPFRAHRMLRLKKKLGVLYPHLDTRKSSGSEANCLMRHSTKQGLEYSVKFINNVVCALIFMCTHYIQFVRLWCHCSFLITEIYWTSSLAFDRFRITHPITEYKFFSTPALYSLFRKPSLIFYSLNMSVFLATLNLLGDPFCHNRIPFWQQKVVEWCKLVGGGGMGVSTTVNDVRIDTGSWVVGWPGGGGSDVLPDTCCWNKRMLRACAMRIGNRTPAY
jgi:hypothetical protein